MSNEPTIRAIGASRRVACGLPVILVTLVLLLSACTTAPATSSNSGQAVSVASTTSIVPTASTATAISTSTSTTPTAPLPSPVGTLVGPFPSTTDTPPPYTPPPAPTLLGPPLATSFPVGTQPAPTQSAQPTQPVGTQTPQGPVTLPKGAGSISNANIAWGSQTDSSLTVWVGVYSDTPVPNISEARAVAKWATPLVLVDLAFSPDGQSLAVLDVDNIPPETEGIWPGWLSVIDLTTNTVQPIPDYNSQYSLYYYAYYRQAEHILGWLDNSRLVVAQQLGEGTAVIATKDGSSYSAVKLPQGVGNDVALSPDDTTLFSTVVNTNYGLWLNNIDGSNPREVLDNKSAKQVYSPKWSPDGKYISFISPKQVSIKGANYGDFTHLAIWLLNPATTSQQAISSENVWDVDPTWSPDSTQLAFLRADGPITDNNVSSELPEKVISNIFTAKVSGLTPHQLTKTQGVKNSGLLWTRGGNLMLSSTANSTTGLPMLIAVSTKDGTVTSLLSGDADNSLVCPTLLRK